MQSSDSKQSSKKKVTININVQSPTREQPLSREPMQTYTSLTRDASMGIYYEDEFQTTEDMEEKLTLKKENITNMNPFQDLQV